MAVDQHQVTGNQDQEVKHHAEFCSLSVVLSSFVDTDSDKL